MLQEYLGLLSCSSLWEQLYEIDCEEAARVRAARCGREGCGSVLDRCDYPRSARGAPSGVREDRLWRLSFCCRAARHRNTPTSVRFLGRKVYVFLVVLVVSALRGGRERVALKYIQRVCGVSEPTARRWLVWWQEKVTKSEFWRSERGHLSPVLDESYLATSLLVRYRTLHPQPHEALRRVCIFLRLLSAPPHYPR